MCNARVRLAAAVALCAAATSAAPDGFLYDLAESLKVSDTGDAVFAKPRPKRKMSGGLSITGGYTGVNRTTSELLATGSVTAVTGVYLMRTDRLTRASDGLYDFGPKAVVTTCTNDLDHLHWHLRADLKFRQNDYAEMRNLFTYYYNLPVFWFPYYYYPFEEGAGWRITPGYTSRWGGYLIGGCVYTLYDEPSEDEDRYNLNAATYGEYRIVNGFALSQQITWTLRDLGWGRVQGWYGWDEDYTRYTTDHADDDAWQTDHWSSRVKRERYRIYLTQQLDFTERDAFRLHGQYLSDNMVLDDFARRGYQRYTHIPDNDVWYEHRENAWSAGVDASGPINKFYSGTQRLPEGWFAVAPQPVFDLPVNYESETRAGYLLRRPADIGSADRAFRYDPYLGETGDAAHYKSFRVDTYHRLTAPMKWWDVLSVNPRAGYRCTWWGDAGSERSGYTASAGDGVTRHIGEAGVTFAARANAWVAENWRHAFEPYLDYTFQRAALSDSSTLRHYYFDNYDYSLDWFDQFGFEGRNLPYSYHGIKPGIRNTFMRRSETDKMRTVLDTDIYMSLPFDDESLYGNDSLNPLRGYVRDQAYGNYAQRRYIVPGFKVKLSPSDRLSLGTRMEYDTVRGKPAVSDVTFRHVLADEFSWNFTWSQRNYRLWDYVSTPSEELRNGNADRWNWERNSIFRIGFTHKPIYWFNWSPYVQYNARDGEVECVGSWFDFLQDCIGYRFMVNYYSRYERIDGSYNKQEVDVTFYIYLRAMGPGSSLDMTLF